jgi:hypothetical protein
MLVLADGTFFPPGCCAIPWGRAGGPAGLAPEAMEECDTPSRFHSQRRLWARHLSQPASVIFQPSLVTPCACIDVCVRSVHIQEV